MEGAFGNFWVTFFESLNTSRYELAGRFRTQYEDESAQQVVEGEKQVSFGKTMLDALQDFAATEDRNGLLAKLVETLPEFEMDEI